MIIIVIIIIVVVVIIIIIIDADIIKLHAALSNNLTVVGYGWAGAPATTVTMLIISMA